MNKGTITHFLRQAGLMYAADRLRFAVMRYRNRHVNRAFRVAHPTVALPPDGLMYDAFQLNYRKYYEDGLDTAKWVQQQLAKYLDLRDKHLLDWGCGPGRIIRPPASARGRGMPLHCHRL